MKPSDRQRVVRCPAISPGGRLLWCLIETYANPDGSGAYPSIETLMRDSGCSKDWVKDHLKELEDWKLLTRGKKQVGSGWPVNYYKLHVVLKRPPIMRGKKATTYEGVKSHHNQSHLPEPTINETPPEDPPQKIIAFRKEGAA